MYERMRMYHDCECEDVCQGECRLGPAEGKRVRLCDTCVRYATLRLASPNFLRVGSTQGRRRADTKCESISSATARKRKASVSELSKDKAIGK